MKLLHCPNFPGGPDAWCEWFIQGHRDCTPETVITRIRFAPAGPVPPIA